MKRALIKERADLSDTMKVTCLIALFPFLLGAYFGGCEGDGAIFSAILCAFSLVPLHIMDGEFTITPEYLRFTETLPLSVRQKVYSKQLYRLFYRLAFFVVGVLGHLGGLLGNETFDGGRMLGFACLLGLFLLLPGAVSMPLTAKRENVTDTTGRTAFLVLSLTGSIFAFTFFLKGSILLPPPYWCILLAVGAGLYFIAAEWAVSLWEERPLP